MSKAILLIGLTKINLLPENFHGRWDTVHFLTQNLKLLLLLPNIENQEQHHRKKAFIEEYTKIHPDFKIEFDPKYIFNPVSDWKFLMN